MGLCISYYLVEDSDIKLAIERNQNILDMLYHNRCNCKNNDCNCEWEIESYHTGVKSWDPCIKLLKLLDKSTDQIINNVLDLTDHNWLDAPPLAIFSIDVKKVNLALLDISQDDVNKAYLDIEKNQTIKSINGYRMHQIENRDLIEDEERTLRDAFNSASKNNLGIVLDIE